MGREPTTACTVFTLNRLTNAVNEAARTWAVRDLTCYLAIVLSQRLLSVSSNSVLHTNVCLPANHKGLRLILHDVKLHLLHNVLQLCKRLNNDPVLGFYFYRAVLTF